MEYEQEFENAVAQMFAVHITIMLYFRTFILYDIDFDMERAQILAPLTEQEHILDYFRRNGFTVKQCVGMLYQVSVVS